VEREEDHHAYFVVVYQGGIMYPENWTGD
jgi:hypothetical protein